MPTFPLIAHIAAVGIGATALMDGWLWLLSRMGVPTTAAYAIAAACSVIDFEAAVIDGWMPAAVRSRLVEAVRTALEEIDVEGLKVASVREGTVGIHARALGAASLPLSDRFLVGPPRWRGEG